MLRMQTAEFSWFIICDLEVFGFWKGGASKLVENYGGSMWETWEGLTC